MKKFIMLTVVMFLLGASLVQAALSGTKGTLEKVYDADAVVAGADGWAQVANAADRVDFYKNAEGNMEYATNVLSGGCWMQQAVAGDYWMANVTNAISWTIEVSIKMSTPEAGVTHDAAMWADANGKGTIYAIRDIGSAKLYAESTNSYDNTDAFHTFRIALDVDDNLIYVWRDGDLLEAYAPSNPGGAQRLIMGDCSSSIISGTVQYEYFAIDATGAYPPPTDKAKCLAPANGEPLAGIDDDLSWNAPDLGTVDHYVLNYRANDPNWTDTANNTVIDPATSPYEPGTLGFDTEYFWRVDVVTATETIEGNVWSFTTVPANPVITTDPAGTTVAAGDPAVLTVEHLNGTSVLWYQDGAPVSGGTSETLTIASTQLSDEGLYHCEVTNAIDTVVSTKALVMTRRHVAAWQFENNLADDSGTLIGQMAKHVQAVDGTGAGVVDENNDPVLVDLSAEADPNYVPGYHGQGIEFFGDKEHVLVPGTEETFDFYPNGLTASLWVKATGGTGTYSAMVGKMFNSATSSVDRGWVLNHANSNGRPRTQIMQWGSMNGPALFPNEFGTNQNLHDGNWHQVVLTFEKAVYYEDLDEYRQQGRIYVDGGGVKYVDGSEVWYRTIGSSTGEPLTCPTVPLMIGIDELGGGGGIIGVIDDVNIWSYPLTGDEVAALYQQDVPGAICVDLEGLEFDVNNDCVINLEDFAVFAATWLNNRIVE